MNNFVLVEIGDHAFIARDGAWLIAVDAIYDIEFTVDPDDNDKVAHITYQFGDEVARQTVDGEEFEAFQDFIFSFAKWKIDNLVRAGGPA